MLLGARLSSTVSLVVFMNRDATPRSEAASDT